MGVQEEWIQIYRENGALWLHDGDLKKPHALLSKGGHSTSYINSEFVLQNPFLARRAAADLLELLCEKGFDWKSPERLWAIGPTMGAISLIDHAAFRLSQMRELFKRPPCYRAFGEKRHGGGFQFDRYDLRPGDLAVLFEDVGTTFESLLAVGEALRELNIATVPYFAVMVNRPALAEVRGHAVVELIRGPFSSWKPEECELCPRGSIALKPREGDNWERLNGR